MKDSYNCYCDWMALIIDYSSICYPALFKVASKYIFRTIPERRYCYPLSISEY